MPITSRFSPCRHMMSEVRTRASCTCAEITARSSASSAINLSSVVAIIAKRSIADALDRRAARRQLLLQPLETTVEMIDAVDHGFALGGEAGNDQGYRGAQIGRHHRRATQFGDAIDGRGLAVERNPRPEARQFLHMHEAVFEDR